MNFDVKIKSLLQNQMNFSRSQNFSMKEIRLKFFLMIFFFRIEFDPGLCNAIKEDVQNDNDDIEVRKIVLL